MSLLLSQLMGISTDVDIIDQSHKDQVGAELRQLPQSRLSSSLQEILLNFIGNFQHSTSFATSNSVSYVCSETLWWWLFGGWGGGARSVCYAEQITFGTSDL